MLAQQTNAAIELDRCVNVPVPNNGPKVGQMVLQGVHVLLLNLKFCVNSFLNSYLLFSTKLKVRLDVYTNVKVMKHCP